MARTHKTILKPQVDESFELDLSPMLALMVCLIPIMLLATVFVKINLIETPLPQVVQDAIQKDEQDKDKKVLISLKMDTEAGPVLDVSRNGKSLKAVKVPRKGMAWDLDSLQSELITLKQEHPDIFRLELRPSEQVPYDDIVKVMDEARQSREGKVKFDIIGADGKTVKSEVMFPNVVFSNVIEG
ncbi:MAG: biopolymer transporter ExbD [Bdellovibrionales bacterium]|nr:biopolymer transporter ExbD [Bdellovibrionales bacterium]